MLLSTGKMDQEDKELFNKLNNKIDVIDKNLDLIKRKVEKLPKQKDNINIFNANILFSFGLVLVTISFTLFYQVQNVPEIYSWMMVVFYLAFGLFFIKLSGKIL